MKVSVKKKAITMTALVSMSDVVFLLLIFFLITSNFITYTGISVPTTQNAHSELQKHLRVSINANEEVFINGVKLNLTNAITHDNEAIIHSIRVEVEKKPDIVVMIEADQNLPLQKVMNLIDMAKSAGAQKCFIAAQIGR